MKRLTSYIEEKNQLSPNQGGFIKGKSTSDHIFLLQTVIEKVVNKGKRQLFAAFIDFKKAYDTVDRDLLLDRLKFLGINGPFLQNITAMYQKTMYSIKLNKGYLTPINSNLGLKQGCPLSPMLFNLYIDDTNQIFGDQCDPIEFQGEKLSHFLYADDLVILSQTENGLQNALDNLYAYSEQKCLSISIKKSKTMIFNNGGRLIKRYFKINNKLLEPVQTFCYLGFDVKASGTVKQAMHTLYDKANKAMRPLLHSIARFNLPVKTSLSLFHAYISPIVLYNAENWMAFTDKQIQNFTSDSILEHITNSKVDILHRKFLKYALGVSSACPNLCMYGETNETPLSLKGLRLMLNFWQRIMYLPDTTLVKKALLENIALRTNWIITIEKLLGNLALTDKIENSVAFKKTAKNSLQSKFNGYWCNAVAADMNKLLFYKSIKNKLEFETYLNISAFEHRKAIAKLRCSDHSLQIEKGRHKKIPRESRFCNLCPLKAIETEDHFLTTCTFFYRFRHKYDLQNIADAKTLVLNTDQNALGKYMCEAFAERKKYKEWFGLD